MKSLRRILITLLVVTAALGVGLVLGQVPDTVYAADGVQADTVVINLPHEIKKSHMLVVDLNGDDKQEILAAGDDGYLMLIDGASYRLVWDKNLADYLPGFNRTRVTAGLASGDLNLDGKLDLVVATGSVDPETEDGPGGVIALTYVGAPDYFKLMPGWPLMAVDDLPPKKVPDAFASTPTLGDIDGDGDLEIIIAGMDRFIYALHHDGSHVVGWPLNREDGYMRDNRSTAAVADIDGDGLNEVIVGSNNYLYPSCANPYLFYVLNGDSTFVPGFPIQTTQNIESSPVVADLDGDGYLDIIFGTGNFDESCKQPTDGKKIYAVDRSGQPLPGWPVRTNADMINSPAVGDLDNDGSLEVVIYNEDTLYAWHADGTLVNGFPQRSDYYLRHHTPTLADIDGDGQVEILLGTGQIYRGNGQLKERRLKLQTTLVVTDQDGDGLLETIGANNWNRSLYIWQETGPATGQEPWPMFHRTRDRAGVFETRYTLSGRVVDGAGAPAAGVEVRLNTGQIAKTDSRGVYRFGNLVEGNYTVTPANGIYRFKPVDAKVSLTQNVEVADFLMLPPHYTVVGKVTHANGSPYPGVQFELSSGKRATSDAQGIVRFTEVLPGQYVLTPNSQVAEFVPAKLSLRAEDEQILTFTGLAKSTTKSLAGNESTQIELSDTQGLATRLVFPAGSSPAQEVRVTPFLPGKVDGYLALGHVIEVTPDPATAPINSPFSIQIEYNEADLRALVQAGQVRLLWKSPDGWVPAEESCESTAAGIHDPQARVVNSTVCAWGVYGLFAPLQQTYIPLIPLPRP